MDLVLIDHNLRTIFHNIGGDRLQHELNMSNPEALFYRRADLTEVNQSELPPTTCFVTRRNNLVWIDTIGDLTDFVLDTRQVINANSNRLPEGSIPPDYDANHQS